MSFQETYMNCPSVLRDIDLPRMRVLIASAGRSQMDSEVIDAFSMGLPSKDDVSSAHPTSRWNIFDRGCGGRRFDPRPMQQE